MKRGDYVSLSRLDLFSSGSYGIILNDKCTAGYVVVGYDSDDVQFRVKVRCELVDVIAPPKFKVGDKVKLDNAVFVIEDFWYQVDEDGWSDEDEWVYGIRANEHYYIIRRESFLEMETA